MKKQIIIFFLVIPFSSWSQGKIIKSITPCNDEALYKTPGKWFTSYGGMLDNGSEYIPFNKAQVKETVTRMNVVRDMLMKIYPEPMGVDAAWHHSIGRGSFGEQVKYVKNNQDILNREPVVEKPIASYGFVCGFFAHGCKRDNPNEIRRGYPGETGTWFSVGANGIGRIANEVTGEEHMLIDGYPVFLRQPMKEKFEGYELFYSKANVFPEYRTNECRVLVHRKSELPYIPVTRKQYLDQCVIYLTKWYSDGLRDFEQQPLQTAEEQKIRKEQIKVYKKMRDDVLKYYTGELEETTKKGLLGSPAIIPLMIYNREISMPIFTEENVGYMVIIENPKYMRKDLPKYVPQLFTVGWSWDEYWKPQADVAKLILEKFPFDKLQAMIDK